MISVQIYLWPEELCFDNGAVRMKICILRYPHSARIFRFSMNPACGYFFSKLYHAKNEFQFINRTT